MARTTSPSVKFCIALHNHQPVGNFEHVFEESYEKCYGLYLDTLDKYPSVRCSLHTSGPLLDWIAEHRPKYMERLRALVKVGRVEILGGGYYEPILSTLPPRDAVAQIRMMSDWVLEHFGTRPRGLWLTERIWEPTLPAVLADSGVEYTLLDDSHFRSSGVENDGMVGHYVSEHHGQKVSIFPIRMDLRYAIPFAEPDHTVNILRHLANVAPGTVVTYGDDGEKFGVWPNTYEWVFENGWLDRFFQAMEANKDWIEMTTMSEAFDATRPTGRVYLPSTSYYEMTQWALPTPAGRRLDHLTHEIKDQGRWDDFEPFIRGGFWNNFLAKYDESNRIHKRMLRVSEKLSRCPAKSQHTQLGYRELFMGQCNCAYWHGLFGGIYLNYLRDALTRHLAKAESYTDLLLYGGAANARVETTDFDADGNDEIVLETPYFRLVAHPADGGTLSEIVLVRYDFALTNVMTRRPEIYHDKVADAATESGGSGVKSAHDLVLAKEANLGDHLHYDPYVRHSMRDRIYPEMPSLDAVYREQADEIPGPPDAIYAIESVSAKQDAVGRLRGSWSVDGQTIDVKKTITARLDDPMIEVAYEFANRGNKPVAFTWGSEWNLTLLAGDADDRRVEFDGKAAKPNAMRDGKGRKARLVDDWQQFAVTLDFGAAVDLRQMPIYTVSQSEGGFEKTYQGTWLVAYRPIKLEPGATRKVRLVLTLDPS
ncbi:MAG: DUF1926 domain-containing protein [Deltaproteobacteria bacterium]|nr:DUF1926 domain-containing protein [Deltaproteobacteria bacterium]